MAAGTPIGDGALEGLFGPHLRHPFALAVSGGADSMALMLLVARWLALSRSLAGDHPAALVLTVDHGLRAGSADEARHVAEAAQRLGMQHETLVWRGPKPSTRIQESARVARYRVIAEYLASEGRVRRELVTAHHLDDQAETLLMRLARGSGLDGLAAMRKRTRAHGLTIVRPLLKVGKADLVATLEAAGVAWIDDPSNDQAAFERVRWRQARAGLDALGLENARLALAARRLGRARDALEAATSDLARQAALDCHRGAYATLDAGIFGAAPEELRVRLLARLIASFGGGEGRASLAAIEDLVERLAVARLGEHAGSTLAGALVSMRSGTLQVMREPGRISPDEIPLEYSASAIWDGRFRVSFAGDGEGTVGVGPLGETGWSEVREHASARSPVIHQAALSLPAFRRDGRLIAVPHLGFASEAGIASSCAAEFLWQGHLESAAVAEDLADWPET